MKEQPVQRFEKKSYAYYLGKLWNPIATAIRDTIPEKKRVTQPLAQPYLDEVAYLEKQVKKFAKKYRKVDTTATVVQRALEWIAEAKNFIRSNSPIENEQVKKYGEDCRAALDHVKKNIYHLFTNQKLVELNQPIKGFSLNVENKLKFTANLRSAPIQELERVLKVIAKIEKLHNPREKGDSERSYISKWQFRFAREIVANTNEYIQDLINKKVNIEKSDPAQQAITTAKLLVEDILTGKIPKKFNQKQEDNREAPSKLKDELNKTIDTFSEEYGRYWAKHAKGFKEVLEFYDNLLEETEVENFQNPQKESTIKRIGRRLWRGHLYKGDYDQTVASSEVFKKLVHRLALINPAFPRNLLDFFNKRAPGNFQNEATQLAFAERLYQLFEIVQQNYQKKLLEDDVSEIDTLFKFLFAKSKEEKKEQVNQNVEPQENRKQKFKALYYQFIYGTEKSRSEAEEAIRQLAVQTDTPLTGKLIYNLNLCRQQRESDLASIEKQLTPLRNDIHTFCFEQGLPKLLKKTTEKEFDFSKTFDPTKDFPRTFYAVTENLADAHDLISLEQQERRRIEHNIDKRSNVSGTLSGIGEGIIAAVAFHAMLPAWPFLLCLLVIGVPGAICNRILLKDGIASSFKNFRLWQYVKNDKGETVRVVSFLIDKNNKPITGWKKISLILAAILSAISGFCYGALSALKAHSLSLPIASKIVGIFGGKALAASIVAGGLAAMPALATAVGIGCILFNIIVDFIKNERWKEIGSYVKNTYFNVPWQEMTGKERAGHVARCIFFEFPKLVFGLGVCAVVTVFTFGFMHASAIGILKKICSFNLASKMSTPLAIANGAIWYPLNAEATTSLLGNLLSVQSILKATIKLCLTALTGGAFFLMSAYHWKSTAPKVILTIATGFILFPIFALLERKFGWAEKANTKIDQWVDSKVRGSGKFKIEHANDIEMENVVAVNNQQQNPEVVEENEAPAKGFFAKIGAFFKNIFINGAKKNVVHDIEDTAIAIKSNTTTGTAGPNGTGQGMLSAGGHHGLMIPLSGITGGLTSTALNGNACNNAVQKEVIQGQPEQIEIKVQRENQNEDNLPQINNDDNQNKQKTAYLLKEIGIFKQIEERNKGKISTRYVHQDIATFNRPEPLPGINVN